MKGDKGLTGARGEEGNIKSKYNHNMCVKHFKKIAHVRRFESA